MSVKRLINLIKLFLDVRRKTSLPVIKTNHSVKVHKKKDTNFSNTCLIEKISHNQMGVKNYKKTSQVFIFWQFKKKRNFEGLHLFHYYTGIWLYQLLDLIFLKLGFTAIVFIFFLQLIIISFFKKDPQNNKENF